MQLFLKDIVPAAQNNINTRFIILDKARSPTTAAAANGKNCIALAADETAAVHIQLWGDECDAFEAGDIVKLTNGIFSYVRNSGLLLRAGKRGKMEKMGEFTVAFVETPNICEIQWNPDPENLKRYIQNGVVSAYSQISGEPESVKKALFDVSAIMYKINPREQIPLDSTGQDVSASIIVPSDLSNSLYPQTGFYSNQDHILQHRAGVPSYFSALSVSDFQGYAETAANPMPVVASSLPVTHSFGGSSRSEELVLKVLCPFSNITRVIGKGGSTIKRISEASGSCIEVNDSRTKCGDDECVIIVTATESPDDMKSMAVEAVLLLQENINDENAEKVKIQLLVPSKVIGCVIGKSGSVINEISKRTYANIRISKGKKDDLVEVSGEVSSVRDALIQIVLRLREDVLGDRDSVAARIPPARSNDSSFFSGSGNAGYTRPSFMSSGPEMASTSGFYGYGSFLARDHGFGSIGPYTFGRLPSSSALEIIIPANAMSKVIGRGGGNLENVRRISRAMIEIFDSKTSHGERITLISGTPAQMRSAENLFQAFIMST